MPKMMTKMMTAEDITVKRRRTKRRRTWDETSFRKAGFTVSVQEENSQFNQTNFNNNIMSTGFEHARQFTRLKTCLHIIYMHTVYASSLLTTNLKCTVINTHVRALSPV